MPRPVTRSSSKPQAASKVASKPANTKAQPAKRKATSAPAKAQKKSKAEDVVESAESKSNEQEESAFAQEVDAISDDDDSSVEENELEEDEKAIETNKADEEESESNEVAEDHEILAGIDSSEDEDSSDDEAAKEDTFSTGQDVITLGSKKDKELKTKTATVKKSPSDKPGVIYLGRIPHGFYEEQMRAYFAQFGEVSRLRMSRNRKTGRSKHFAFIEFKTGEVADIVAETMNNYLLYGHLLKCQVVPEEKQHPKLWEGADRKFKAIPWNKLAREQQNKAKTPEQREKLVNKLVKKDQKKREKLAAMGVEYEFPGYEAEIKPKATHVKF